MSNRILLISFLVFLGLTAFNGCLSEMGSNRKDTAPLDFDDENCEDLLIDETEYNNAQVDEHEIVYAFIQNDTLKVIVKYGGGCGFADFQLISNGAFMESYPVQLNLILSLIDDDPCEAVIQRQLCFGISNLADLYNDSYQTSEGTIILHLNNYDSELTYDF